VTWWLTPIASSPRNSRKSATLNFQPIFSTLPFPSSPRLQRQSPDRFAQIVRTPALLHIAARRATPLAIFNDGFEVGEPGQRRFQRFPIIGGSCATRKVEPGNSAARMSRTRRSHSGSSRRRTKKKATTLSLPNATRLIRGFRNQTMA